MNLWDVAMTPVRAAGGAFHELDMAMQGKAPRSRDQQQLLADLQMVKQTTPDNTPARIDAVRQVMGKHGLSMPPGLEPYEQIPTPYERGMGEYAQAKAAAAQGGSDPVKKATAVSKLLGARPWSGDDGDDYDETNPEHRIWMQSLEELGGGAQPPAPARPEAIQADEAVAARQPGSALAQIPDPNETPQQETMAAAMGARPAAPRPPQSGAEASPAPAAPGTAAPAAEPRRGNGIFSRMAASLGRATPTGGISRPAGPGSALEQIPSPQQVDQALTQYENAGGVTARNAGRVALSQAAPADTLKTAARAVKAYKASPEYAAIMKETGRLFNETELSGPAKELLAGQSAADQKRLLRLIHKHGEQAVLAAAQKNAKPKGNF